jgi:hypothetical protein
VLTLPKAAPFTIHATHTPIPLRLSFLTEREDRLGLSEFLLEPKPPNGFRTRFRPLISAGGEGGIGFAVLRGFAPILADCLFGLKALTEPKGSHPSGEQKGSVGLAWLGKFIEPVPAGGEGGIDCASLQASGPMPLASSVRPKGPHRTQGFSSLHWRKWRGPTRLVRVFVRDD